MRSEFVGMFEMFLMMALSFIEKFFHLKKGKSYLAFEFRALSSF